MLQNKKLLTVNKRGRKASMAPVHAALAIRKGAFAKNRGASLSAESQLTAAATAYGGVPAKKIKEYLDKWNLRGHHVFPRSMWGNPYLNAIMNLEPRCISYIANAGHIDINELARAGPMRRSDTARNLWQTLSPDQRMLMNNGVEFVRENFKRKKFVFQGCRWDAMLYDWPRETMPTLEDLMDRVLN